MKADIKIPEDAVKIHYQPHQLPSADFWVWERDRKWYWYALGGDGRENSFNEACQAARSRIIGEFPRSEKKS
jgi:hypothetical protein